MWASRTMAKQKTLQPALPPALSGDDRKLIRQLYVDGVSIEELAQKWELDPIEIGDILRDNHTQHLQVRVLPA